MIAISDKPLGLPLITSHSTKPMVWHILLPLCVSHLVRDFETCPTWHKILGGWNIVEDYYIWPTFFCCIDKFSSICIKETRLPTFLHGNDSWVRGIMINLWIDESFVAFINVLWPFLTTFIPVCYSLSFDINESWFCNFAKLICLHEKKLPF